MFTISGCNALHRKGIIFMCALEAVVTVIKSKSYGQGCEEEKKIEKGKQKEDTYQRETSLNNIHLKI